MAPVAEQLSELVKRQYYGNYRNCGSGYYSDRYASLHAFDPRLRIILTTISYGGCYRNSNWNRWGRWVALVLIVVFFVFVFFMLS